MLVRRSVRSGEPREIATECARLSAANGLGAALKYLNDRARYRFTGIYRAAPPVLHNVVLFDRENPSLNVSGKQAAFDETYCAITYATHQPFVARNSLKDQRLVTHAARENVVSYAGVPIRLPNGLVWGSLCHFDERPRLLPVDELIVLEAVVPVLAKLLELNQTA